MTAHTTTGRIVGRRPKVAPAELVGTLAVTPHFAQAHFDTYVPDPAFPSQKAARDAARTFAKAAAARRPTGRGLYLDGGFGVGKTHLLAAMAHAVGKRASFGTFLEYTNLVGALGFATARDELARFRLVCIDEFELDDPGDTLIMARLIRELTDAGVAVAATSNTPPGALGEGRFAAEDFAREIKGLAAKFEKVMIDGPDYRHREELPPPEPATDLEVAAVESLPGGVVEDWPALVADLAHVHPSRYSAYIEGCEVLGLRGVAPLPGHNEALRLVMLVDRLYDEDVRLVASGASLGDVFSASMLKSGYRKKYLRALSRLHALSSSASP